MLAVRAQTISSDLERIVCHVEDGHDLGVDFCDRLTRSLAQLYVIAEASCSEQDRASFDRILVRLVATASSQARLFLSGHLSDRPHAPRAILLTLANDIVEVARPLLAQSPALSEDDLIDIARNRGPGHMSAIAERSDLPIRVTDILVLRGDDVVRRIVAANRSARLSDKSFARMSLQARTDTLIEARLIRRGDLPDLIVHFLIENGSPAGREALAGRDRSAMPRRSLEGSTLPIRAAEDGWLDTYDFDTAARVLDRLDEVRNHIDGFVRRLAQCDQFPEIVHVLSAVTDIRLDTMKHLMVSLDTEPFAVIARALTLKTDTVRRVMATGPWLHRLDNRIREATLTVFRSVDEDSARARLQQWASHEIAAAAR